eukprot:scaffold50473_cov59-Attheya_sp.AAC.6
MSGTLTIINSSSSSTGESIANLAFFFLGVSPRGSSLSTPHCTITLASSSVWGWDAADRENREVQAGTNCVIVKNLVRPGPKLSAFLTG